ncbi:MAG: hypothetical protein ACTHZM_07765 [Canibacter sp.]
MSDVRQTRELGVDVVVVGDSPTACQSALDFAEVGLAVVVLADQSSPDWPIGAVPDPNAHVAAFIDRVAKPVSDDVPEDPRLAARTLPQPRNFIAGHDGKIREISRPELLGIPGVPLNSETSALLGSGTAFRAYLDRIAPVLSVGKQPSIWKLVQSRMGKKTAQKLLRPFLLTRFGAPLDEIETAVAAPGLNEALTRAGALSGAVLALTERWADHERSVDAPAGWHAVRTAAIEKLELFNATVIQADAAEITYTEHSDDNPSAQHEPQWQTVLEDGRVVTSRVVVADRNSSAHERAGTRITVPGEPAPPLLRSSWSIPVTSTTSNEFWHAKLEAPDSDDAACGASHQRAVIQVVDASGPDSSLSITRALTSEAADADAIAELRFPVHANTHVSEAARVAALTAAGAEPLPNTDWTERVTAAPFTQAQDRANASRILAQAEQHNWTLSITGALWHGDNLSDALVHAHSRAVQLRRELTGIAEH